MAPRHVHDRLAAFADKETGATEAAQIDAHLRACASCREAWDRYQFAATSLRLLGRAEAPPDVLTSIERALAERREQPDRPTRSLLRPSLALAAVCLVVAAAAGAWWLAARPAPWDIVRLDAASPRAGRLAMGDWVETGAAATSRIRIGEIGIVEAGPDTRLQILAARPGEHRLSLARGRISAEIVAPPRVFFVETPASTIVDLGCAYTMEVDEDGTGLLQVTDGWASLEWDGRESLVPAGASAATRPGVGPGTPSFDAASDRLKGALLALDFGPPAAAAAALDVVLAEAHDRDTLTLWHLLSRVAPGDRLRVFDRLVELTPLPAGVDRERALALDPETMTFWRQELAWTW